MTLSGSFVHGIFQLRIQECVAIFPPGDLAHPGIKQGSPALQVDSLPAELSGLMYVASSSSEVNVNLASFLIFTSGRKRGLMFISDCSVVLLGQFEIWIFEAVEILISSHFSLQHSQNLGLLYCFRGLFC